MNKHTQGPWQVNKKVKTVVETVEGGQGINLIADCSDPDGNRSRAEDEANAMLIASAPELLEALEDIVKFYSDNIKIMPVAFQTFSDLAEQAIKKAKGK